MAATIDETDDAQSVPLRAPETVMKLARMGSFHQTRLSFMRGLMRRLKRERWAFARPVWRIDDKGVGVGVYSAAGPERTYSLIAYANDLDPAKRSDRVIAEEWDATFTLFDGVPTEDDIERLSHHVPKQEAGHISGSELSLSRANRSVRLFEYVRDCLAKGEQPEAAELDKVGYLMRTTAVYGSAKFGACDRRFIADRPEFQAPFQAELLSVYLTRAFTVDIVEHMAEAKAPETAVKLDPDLGRRLGVGNSTGLGMAPFIVNHPALLNNWIVARETALARVRSIPETNDEVARAFRTFVERQKLGAYLWSVDHERQAARIKEFRKDMERLHTHCRLPETLSGSAPWDRLFLWGEANLSMEGQECLVSLMIEPHGEFVDDLVATMSTDESATFRINGAMKLRALSEIVTSHYHEALQTDFDDPAQTARFWYASEEKLEPRLGERHEEDGAEREHPLCTWRNAKALATDIATWSESETGSLEDTVAEFLLRHPEHRQAVRRAQIVDKFPYAEIQDNLISEDMLPIDLLRCKLSFFGANKFDPRSDRWVRITMYQHTPMPNELAQWDADDWIYPPLDSEQ